MRFKYCVITACINTAHSYNYYDILIHRSHIYDAVELYSQKVKTPSTTTDYENPLFSNSTTMPSTTNSQDIKADRVQLRDNPSYVATNESS